MKNLSLLDLNSFWLKYDGRSTEFSETQHLLAIDFFFQKLQNLLQTETFLRLITKKLNGN